MEKVTRARLEDKAHYRLQLNVYQPHIAYCYNALNSYLPRAAMDRIRNTLADRASLALLEQFRIEASKGNVEELIKYLNEGMDAELQDECRQLWQSIGVYIF